MCVRSGRARWWPARRRCGRRVQMWSGCRETPSGALRDWQGRTSSSWMTNVTQLVTSLRKWEVGYHGAAIALNYFAYNFIKIHLTLRTSPPMAAGLETRLWSVDDLVALWESHEREAERAA